MPTPILACMAAVAAFYQLPTRALPAIHGTDDLGAMQINTLWLPALAKATGLPQPRLRRALIQQDCFNVAVAGAILRVYLKESGGDLLTAIGDYHSHTPELRDAYELRVLSTSLLARPTPPKR